jgi:hypothetical protein
VDKRFLQLFSEIRMAGQADLLLGPRLQLEFFLSTWLRLLFFVALVAFCAFAASACGARQRQIAERTKIIALARNLIPAPLSFFHNVALIARSARKGRVNVRLEEFRVR